MIPQIDFDRTEKEIPQDIRDAVSILPQGHIAWLSHAPVVMKGSRKVALLDPADLANAPETAKTLKSVWHRY